MQVVRMRKVFVPGGQPEHTYVSRTQLQLEPKLRAASDNLCKLVTVTGPTKCGKTVLTQKIFPRTQHIWIDGGSVDREEDLWTQIVDQLDLFTDIAKTSEDGSAAGASGNVSGALQIPLFAMGEVKVSPSYKKQRSTGKTTGRTLAPKARALQGLGDRQRALIIDDFHYLGRHIQGSVVRALKALVFDGKPVILIAIPHRRYDAVRVEKEMTGRVQDVRISSWTENELADIPGKGFPILNLQAPQTIIEKFVDECLASPHLMQEFCRQLCDQIGVDETQAIRRRIQPTSSLNTLFEHVAANTSKTVFDRLAKGPRQRSDRNQRLFKDGGTGDIYVAVLHAIANLKPGITTLGYEEIRSALRDLLVELPQAHEVSRVLKHMSNIQADEASSAPVLDWEEDERLLHIIDPFFAFFLRWGAPNLHNELLQAGR
jgi:hypothetical protein